MNKNDLDSERISKPYFSQLIYDCQQIAIKIDTQHETGQVSLGVY